MLGAVRNAGGAITELGDANEASQALMARDNFLNSQKANRSGDTFTGLITANARGMFFPTTDSAILGEASLEVRGSSNRPPRIGFTNQGVIASQFGMFPGDTTGDLSAFDDLGTNYASFRALQYKIGAMTVIDAARNGTFATVVNIAGNPAWHAGNDGVGSGLDTDLIRGLAPGAASGVATLNAGSRLVQDVRDLSVNTAHLVDLGVTAAKLASGVALSNLGVTPVNRAGDTMTGALTATTISTNTSTSSGFTAIGASGAFSSLGWDASNNRTRFVSWTGVGGSGNFFFESADLLLHTAGRFQRGGGTTLRSFGLNLDGADNGISMRSVNVAVGGAEVFLKSNNYFDGSDRFSVGGVGIKAAQLNLTQLGNFQVRMSSNVNPATDAVVTWNAFNSFWHAGNMGPGSGMNADLLDGLDSSAFLLSATAASTYLTQANAASTYFTIASAANKADVSSLSAYLTTVAASSTYATLAGNPNFTGLPTVSSNRIVDRSSFIDGSTTLSGTLLAGVTTNFTIAVTGAVAGDFVLCALDSGFSQMLLTGSVSAASTVLLNIFNGSTVTQTLSGTGRVRVFKRAY